MAEIALRNVEQGLDELEQLERIALFDKKEIRAIVKRRRHFEYRMRRFVKSRADFLQYINYEISLYQLIQKRRERTKIMYKKSDIEHAITSRIDLLFKKAEYKFAGDMALWFSHIEFCKLVKWRSQASVLFTRLLQLHPKNADVWIACAKFQLEDIGEVDVARKTLQRGLRFLSDSVSLWTEYFKLELYYWEKINKRQEILDLDSEAMRDAILDGEIVVIAFSNAIEKIPRAAFAIELLKILKAVEKTEKILAKLDAIVEETFRDSPETWSYKAASSPTVREAFNVFEEALKTCPDTDAVWDDYLKFVLRRAHVTQKPKYVQKVLILMSRCGPSMSRDLVLERIRLTHDLSLAKQATEKYPHDIEAWCIYLALESAQTKDSDNIWRLFERAELQCSIGNDVTPLWRFVIEYFKANHPTQIEKIFEKGILKPSSVGVFIKEAYLDHILEQKDAAKTLAFFNKLLALKPLNVSIYEKFLQAFDGQKNLVRRVFNDALRELGSDHEDLWVSYIRWEQQSGNAANSGLLYQRALDTLEGEHVKNFVDLYTLEMELSEQ